MGVFKFCIFSTFKYFPRMFCYQTVLRLLSQSCHREADDDKEQEVESFEVSE